MINDLLNHIISSVEHFRVGGYWIAFFAALVETTAGIGLILPGSTIILLLGALSARGFLDLGDLIWFAVFGAIIGDNVNTLSGGDLVCNGLRMVFGSSNRITLIKAFHHPRPDIAIFAESSFSFPSGHAAISVALYGVVKGSSLPLAFIAGYDIE